MVQNEKFKALETVGVKKERINEYFERIGSFQRDRKDIDVVNVLCISNPMGGGANDYLFLGNCVSRLDRLILLSNFRIHSVSAPTPPQLSEHEFFMTPRRTCYFLT